MGRHTLLWSFNHYLLAFEHLPTRLVKISPFPILMTSAITPQFSKSDYITSQCQHLVLRYAVATSHNSLLVVLSQNSLSQSYESRWLPPCRCICIFVLKRVFYRSSPCWALAVSVTGPRVISRDRPSSLRNASSDHTDNIRFISVFLKLEARFQIGAIRPIRVDHTDFFKWLLKLIHSWQEHHPHKIVLH